ncbi:type II restriction/modification system DNA methylase subunit YeeA [Marinobacter sp. MBR-99]|uniref:BREX-1 system adenine-specific DNA-methyltransferase PglX n=1 Tax=Marinobacter sp. MBR-99 TaxID=3156461 RepID=UPI00339203E2
METGKLKKFAQFARRSLLEQVTAKLKLVLADESPARRERPQAIKKLEEAIAEQSKEQVIERVAYIWFNRFCALRFMDVNRYNRIGIVSPAEGQFQPEILADAKMGHIDEEMVSESTRQKIFTLLDGKTPSQDPQGEAYRLLVVAACNYWYSAMPFLFERIDDYTELLMPDDLLSGNSILAYTREAMTPDTCEDVEVIGWLYQFYISEKKDQVFADLKKNKKVTPENIPAATQLFTPHWIVRYLVENSLGRLWMLNRPDSGLIERMDYYIKPEEPETDFLRINSPEEIKICDPACGSGHMLTYAFDLLYAIYEEEGYEPAEIPEKILTHNLYGIEIDERAGELAAFALTMKARSKQRRFFRKPVQPNICVLESVRFDEGELKEYMEFVGYDLFTAPLQNTLRQFEEADNFGSLICPDVTDVDDMLRILEPKNVSNQLFISMTHHKVLQALRQADYLSPKYHVVIANPPYMGGKGMNGRLAAWVKDNYPNSKSDLFAMFIERNLDLAQKHGAVAMITMQSWMFLSSFEALRARVLGQNTLLSMAHLGARAFDSIGGEVVSTTAFVLENSNRLDYKGGYLRLVAGNSEAEKDAAIREAVMNPDCGWLYHASAIDFKRIPGSPISYWVNDNVRAAFDDAAVEDVAIPKFGMSVGDGERFIRFWYEIGTASIGSNCNSEDIFAEGGYKWCPMDKGGEYKKWYGNQCHVVLWENRGHEIRNFARSAVRSPQYFFKPHFSWTLVASGAFSSRYFPHGYILDTASNCIYFEKDSLKFKLLGFFNSKLSSYLLQLLNPTMNFSCGVVGKLPSASQVSYDKSIADSAIKIAKDDFDYNETSILFPGGSISLLDGRFFDTNLAKTYSNVRAHWREMTLETQRLEEENNRIFIDAYGLQDELTPEVPLDEITLTCNPHYRYGSNKSEEELEALLLADTMRDLVSYAVGCMFGRYALDKPGLILANQGETIEDYLERVPEPSFPADDDNVIPMLDGDWFTDDITERFREFLRIAFGEEHYDENLRFVEQALGKDIRKYFLKDFYNDHVRRYKKRPIYWLFSSPKGSFNALIYMHRYQPHTVGTVLEYLRDFKDEKLQARKNHLEAVSISAGASQGDKTKALKEIEKINKILAELDDYERDVLYPLATEQVEIDLDDGVKANYPKFGEALKKITGLSG